VRLRVVLSVTTGIALAASCTEPIGQIELEDVTSVRVTPDSADLPIGRTVQVRAFPLDDTGAFLAGQPAEWRSEDPSVATVDDQGLATGVATGSVEIVATVAAHEGRARLNVAPPAEVALSRDSVAFEASAGENDPPPESVEIANAGGFPLVGLSIDSVLYGAAAADWLAAELDGSTAPATLTLTPIAAGVSTTGDYLATVWLSGLEADNSPASVRAVLQMASGPAATLAVNDGDGQSATVGAAVATAPSVLVTDGFGNPVENAEVTFEVTGGNGSVVGEADLTDALGVARVGSWTLGTVAGVNTLSATVTGAAPVDFTATGLRGPATQVVVSAGDDQSAVAGAAVAIPPAVQVLDQFDNGVEGLTVTFEVASGDGSVSGGSQTTGADGSATVGAWTLGAVAGPNTLDATVVGLAGLGATFTATGLTGDAVGLVYVAGDAQADTVAATLPIAYAVRVVDTNDNGIEGIAVSWSITGGDNGSVPETSTTDVDGLATAVRVLGTMAGPQTVQAAVGGLGSVGFTATARAGAPAVVAAVVGGGQSATVATDVPVAPEIVVRDQFTNPIEGHGVTFVVTAGGGSASPLTPLVTAANGTAGVDSWTLGITAGPDNNALTATADGVGLSGNPVVFTATATADEPASIEVFAGDDQTAITGANVGTTPTAVVLDQFDNPVPDVAVTFSASGSGSEGTPNATTNSFGRASTTWTVSTNGGAPVASDGTFQNTLTATVQGTAFSTAFTGFAIYSYDQHVDPLWAPGGCTGCHGAPPGASGLPLAGSADANYAELVTEPLVCDVTLPAGYRRVSTSGGVDAADDLSILMRMVESPFDFSDTGTCDVEMPPGTSGMSPAAIAVIRAWIRNGAPDN